MLLFNLFIEFVKEVCPFHLSQRLVVLSVMPLLLYLLVIRSLNSIMSHVILKLLLTFAKSKIKVETKITHVKLEWKNNLFRKTLKRQFWWIPRGNCETDMVCCRMFRSFRARQKFILIYFFFMVRVLFRDCTGNKNVVPLFWEQNMYPLFLLEIFLFPSTWEH